MCGGNEPAPIGSYRTQPHLEPICGLVVEEFPIAFDGTTYSHGRIVYVANRPPRPVVLVHHNYAGLKQFDVDQAAYLARCGYVGLAVDLYPDTPAFTHADRTGGASVGADGADGADTADLTLHYEGAFAAMQALLVAPARWRDLMAAFLDAAFDHPAVELGRAACIGYCLGGQSCLEQLRAGHPIEAACTFHGLLQSRPLVDPRALAKGRLTAEEYAATCNPPPATHTPGCRVLIENGAADAHVPAESLAEFEEEMEGAAVDWRLHQHGRRTPHGFALPPGLIANAYCEDADRRSTLAMLGLLRETWPDVPQLHVDKNACGTLMPQGPPIASSWTEIAEAAASGQLAERREEAARATAAATEALVAEQVHLALLKGQQAVRELQAAAEAEIRRRLEERDEKWEAVLRREFTQPEASVDGELSGTLRMISSPDIREAREAWGS